MRLVLIIVMQNILSIIQQRVFSQTIEWGAETHDKQIHWSEAPIQYPNGTWICDRPWPQVELFLPLATHYSQRDSRYYEYESMFLRSLLLFYPLKLSNSSLRLVFDAESSHGNGYYHEIVETFASNRKKIPGGLFVSHSEPSEWYHRPTDRQQLMMLWADNFTESEFVAFVDSDAVFLTAVDREDLFEEGKPVINGRLGPHDEGDFWATAPAATYDTLHVNETMRCMSYFPVVVKTSHLSKLREYIVGVHGNNQTFDEIFKHVSGRHFCFFQFNVICTYLFHFHQNEYKWYAHPIVKHNWDGKSPPANAYQNSNVSLFKNLLPSFYDPKPRIATHARYRSFKARYMGNIILNRIHMNLVLQQGICLSPPLISSSANYKVTHLHRDDPICENVSFAQKPYVQGIRTVKEAKYYEEMHIFEFFDWTSIVPDKKLIHTHNERMDRIRFCRVNFERNEYKVIMKRATEMRSNGWERS